MGDLPMSPYRWLPPLPPQPQTPPPPSKSNVPMLYYSLVVVGTAAVAVALYNLVVIRWCTHRTSAASAQPRAWLVEITGGSQSSEDPGRNLLSSFKYKKDAVLENGELECAVCLSAVEDGEEVRQLPRCKHTFHVSCIDMWLYSHSDCPLCRAPAVPPLFNGLQEPANSQENSREGLLPVVTL